MAHSQHTQPMKTEKSKKVADKINKANILESFELLSHMLNMFARISDGTQFRDTKGKPWKLIAEGWGQFTTIHKQEAL